MTRRREIGASERMRGSRIGMKTDRASHSVSRPPRCSPRGSSLGVFESTENDGTALGASSRVGRPLPKTGGRTPALDARFRRVLVGPCGAVPRYRGAVPARRQGAPEVGRRLSRLSQPTRSSSPVRWVSVQRKPRVFRATRLGGERARNGVVRPKLGELTPRSSPRVRGAKPRDSCARSPLSDDLWRGPPDATRTARSAGS